MMRAKYTRFSHLLDRPELPAYNAEIIPRTIWSYWGQGEANAPEIVQFCWDSWRKKNPSWTLRVLEDDTLSQFIETAGIPENVTRTRQSNIIRMRLLSKYGGVWADSTTYCTTELDSWLPLVTGSGFFAFQQETKRRGIATWFMASTAGGYVIERYKGLYEPHLQEFGEKYKWAVQYTFEYLTRTDRRFISELKNMPRISAQPSLEIERWMRDPDVWPEPNPRYVPIHKFSWKTEMPLEEIKRVLSGV